MKIWQGIVWKLMAIVLIVFFGGWFLGGLLNTMALARPEWFSSLFCPPGSTASIGYANGQPELTIICQDRNGQSVVPLSDAESMGLQHKYFYTPSNILLIILVAGWFGWSYIRRRKREQAGVKPKWT